MAQAGEIDGQAPGRPTPAGERLVTLDFIRGLAVLGILFANITAFAQPYTAYFWPPALAGGFERGDAWVWAFQFVFVDGKFRGLFTLLFGAGMMLFMDRGWARGEARGLQFRRLCWLLAFGLVHYFLIWRGDILTLYAVAGLMALAAVRLPAVTQLAIGLTMYLFGQLAMAFLMAGSWIQSSSAVVRARMSPHELFVIDAAPAQILAEARSEVALYGHGSWLEIVSDTISRHAGDLVQELVLVVPTETLGLLFIGMALYRVGLFGGAIDPAVLRRWGWIGVAVGVAASVPAAAWAMAGDFGFFRTLLVFNGLSGLLHLPTVLGLLALLTAWAPSATQGWLCARFAAAGRMAFSNYLGTSVLMVAIFQGWGLGLFGRFHRIELFALVALGWLLMLGWSKPWLARFHYGPLEWLWRCLTYWQVFPLRR